MVKSNKNKILSDDIMHEITQEENDKRLILIEIHNGLCPICNKNIIHRFDWEWSIEFNTQKRIYSCPKCGFVAKEIRTYYSDVVNMLEEQMK